MKVLVTGGCGFIGSNFIHYLFDKYPYIEITNLDKLTYAANRKNLEKYENNPRYKFVQGDICDSKLVNKLVKDIDLIVHFAAESHVDRSIESSAEFIRTNVLGTQVLLDAALRNGRIRFHHISTDEVFGSLGEEGYFNEETTYDPRSPYSASKASSDHLVKSYFHTHRLPITISNCSNNYGPYQFTEKLIPLFITNLIDGKKVPVYGEGKNVRDWIHVLDHCEAINLIIQKGKIGETYCIGGNYEKTNMQITKLILEHFGKGEEMISFVPDRKGHDFRYAIDSSKIKRELGWTPKHNFEQGLKETIHWYKENENWWRKIKNSEHHKVKKTGLKDELKSILRYVRRIYYFKFKRDYVMEQLRRRKGKCGMHGCCNLTGLNKLFSRKCLDKKDKTKCLRWDNLPFMCYAYPFDEKDKNHLAKDICNFYWDDLKKKKPKLEVKSSNFSHN